MVKKEKIIEFREKEEKRKKTNRKKSRLGDDLQPNGDGVTVGEAKELLISYNKDRGYPVKSIRYFPAKEYFLIKYGHSKTEKFSSGEYKGLGPYCLDQKKITWDLFMWIYRKENKNVK